MYVERSLIKLYVIACESETCTFSFNRTCRTN